MTWNSFDPMTPNTPARVAIVHTRAEGLVVSIRSRPFVSLTGIRTGPTWPAAYIRSSSRLASADAATIASATRSPNEWSGNGSSNPNRSRVRSLIRGYMARGERTQRAGRER